MSRRWATTAGVGSGWLPVDHELVVCYLAAQVRRLLITLRPPILEPITDTAARRVICRTHGHQRRTGRSG